MGDNLEQVLGVLNGVVGDYLHRTGNGLAVPMQLIHDGRPLAASRAAIARAFPAATPRVVVLVHGLMATELAFRMPDGENYGSRLARDLGYIPFYVRYNSGLHISENGEALDRLLEQLVDAYPVPIAEICLIGHSMGGLLIRSAAHAASVRGGITPAPPRWLPLVERTFYLGTPHLGAPLERFGNVVGWALRRLDTPYTRLLADLVALRSSGIKDLRYGNLRREAWEGAPGDEDALLQNREHPVPLLPHIRHHLIAGTLAAEPHLALLFGDAIVPLASATGLPPSGARALPRSASARRAIVAPDHVRVLPSIDHLSLAHHLEVYAVIRTWCEEPVKCNVGAA